MGEKEFLWRERNTQTPPQVDQIFMSTPSRAANTSTTKPRGSQSGWATKRKQRVPKALLGKTTNKGEVITKNSRGGSRYGRCCQKKSNCLYHIMRKCDQQFCLRCGI